MAALTVNDLLEGHVGLDIESLDRVYLNGYVPNLQVGGQVVSFMTQHLGFPIPSPAIMEKIGTSFRRAVRAFAAAQQVPIVLFGKDVRKHDVMGPYLRRQAETGCSGVAAIGVAQEYQNVFSACQRADRGRTGRQVWFSFHKADRRVTCFYFYLWDTDFGQRLSRCAPTSPIRSRSGSTATSGLNGKRSRLGSDSRSCPTASPAARTRPGCRRSVTGWAQAASRYSSNGG